jgi:hypothetical protein
MFDTHSSASKMSNTIKYFPNIIVGLEMDILEVCRVQINIDNLSLEKKSTQRYESSVQWKPIL